MAFARHPVRVRFRTEKIVWFRSLTAIFDWAATRDAMRNGCGALPRILVGLAKC